MKRITCRSIKRLILGKKIWKTLENGNEQKRCRKWLRRAFDYLIRVRKIIFQWSFWKCKAQLRQSQRQKKKCQKRSWTARLSVRINIRQYIYLLNTLNGCIRMFRQKERRYVIRWWTEKTVSTVQCIVKPLQSTRDGPT